MQVRIPVQDLRNPEPLVWEEIPWIAPSYSLTKMSVVVWQIRHFKMIWHICDNSHSCDRLSIPIPRRSVLRTAMTTYIKGWQKGLWLRNYIRWWRKMALDFHPWFCGKGRHFSFAESVKGFYLTPSIINPTIQKWQSDRRQNYKKYLVDKQHCFKNGMFARLPKIKIELVVNAKLLNLLHRAYLDLLKQVGYVKLSADNFWTTEQIFINHILELSQ